MPTNNFTCILPPPFTSSLLHFPSFLPPSSVCFLFCLLPPYYPTTLAHFTPATALISTAFTHFCRARLTAASADLSGNRTPPPNCAPRSLVGIRFNLLMRMSDTRTPLRGYIRAHTLHRLTRRGTLHQMNRWRNQRWLGCLIRNNIKQ
jgi:hypothetical protein